MKILKKTHLKDIGCITEKRYIATCTCCNAEVISEADTEEKAAKDFYDNHEFRTVYTEDSEHVACGPCVEELKNENSQEPLSRIVLNT